MKRGTLFLRIFLWFLGAMLLMAAVSIGLTVFMTQQGIILSGQQEVLSDALDRNGQKVLETLEAKGAEAAMEQSEEIRRETGLAIFLFDKDGTPLRLKDGPPREFLERVGREIARNLAEG